jgi:hypothetical protein
MNTLIGLIVIGIFIMICLWLAEIAITVILSLLVIVVSIIGGIVQTIRGR